MQLTPQEQQLFEQLGHSPVFREWLKKREAERLLVLKRNTVVEQLCQAQGAMALVDDMKTAAGIQ